jgi:hypothetical protein
MIQRSKGQAYTESQGWTVVGAFEDLDVFAIKLSPWGTDDHSQTPHFGLDSTPGGWRAPS